MKKLALALVFGVVSLGTVSAQTTKTKVNKSGSEVKVKQEDRKDGRSHEGKQKNAKSPAEKAEHKTSRMAEQLGLTADQTTRLREINLQKAEKMNELKAKHGENRKAMGTEMQSVKSSFEADLKNVLSADQYKKYQEQQEARRAKMKDKKNGNHGKHKGQQKSK